MPEDILTIALAFPEIAGGESWRGIGLAEEGEGNIRLLYSTSQAASGDVVDFITILFSMPIDGSGEAEPKLLVDATIDPAPRWNATRTPKGFYIAAMELAAGAFNELRVVEPGQYDIQLQVKNPVADFSAPRFVKPVAKSGYAVSAAVDREALVLFVRDEKSGYGLGQEICKAELGVVTKLGDKWSVLYKTRVPGPVRGRMVYPGKLNHLLLGADLKPVGEPSKPLGDTVVYEIDADLFDSSLAILATTETDGVLAVGSVASTGGLTLTQQSPLGAGGVLSDPNLLVAGGVMNFAAFQSGVADGRRVLTGFAALAPDLSL